ncbi:DUF5677 domain-containing protein [Labrenzia sp. R5_0]|uniref:DUF5677 domain-containing protein n=1 Tax=Labrenzia sp. R5_0 TaxID=2821108 RepID=UPI001ADB7CCC|nr:DUF5677 domain-containing protein [Labrenzia sp. R5_0]MBO9462473.1 hypothetical protein [Labrenzia sp. R5_0]
MSKNAAPDETETFPDDYERIDIRKVTKRYVRKRSEFLALTKRANRISLGSGGFPSTGVRMYWASVLFTRISVTAKSIEKLLPKPKPGEHWDFSAVASLVRNLLEATLAYHWLCGSNVSEPVREGRYILLCLHDYGSRRKLFPESFSANKEVFDDLLRKFDSNSYLAALSDKKKKEALKGEKTPYIQDDVLVEMGIEQESFRTFYRFLSQHTHTGPLSYFRMGENDLGVGVETRLEKNYMMLAIEAALTHLSHVVDEHLTIFPDAETATPLLSLKEIKTNVEIEQGRKSDRRLRNKQRMRQL